MSFDVLGPLLDNTYYENTFKFLFTEYYNCVKNQRELIDSLPNDFNADDKMTMLTMNLLYGNAYAKKLIFKEILDLVLYNANFLMSLKVSALMEATMKKNYDSSQLGPHPQVEELTGGGNIAFLRAIMFFSFIVLYRALSEQQSQVSMGFAETTAIQIINPQNVPRNFDDFKTGLKNPLGNTEFDSQNPEHLKLFTSQYDISLGMNPIKSDKELVRPVGDFKKKYLKNLPIWEKTLNSLMSNIDPNNDNFSNYVDETTEEFNKLNQDLFSTIQGACESVTGIAQEDQLPIEVFKIVNHKISSFVENNAVPELNEQYEAALPAIREQTTLQFGNVPEEVTLGDRVSQGVKAANKAANQGLGFLKSFSFLKSNSNTESNPISATSATERINEKVAAQEEYNKLLAENENQAKMELTQNIIVKQVQEINNDLRDQSRESLYTSNRQKYLGSVCSQWFVPPKLNYNQENQILSISNSAESFSSLEIILRNIIKEANQPEVSSNVNEDKRKSLIQKAKLLNDFIIRYNNEIYRVMNPKNFGSIQEFTFELQNVVKELKNNVAFVFENSFPIDVKEINEKNKRQDEETAAYIKQQTADQKRNAATTKSDVEKNTADWENRRKQLEAFGEGAYNYVATGAQYAIQYPVMDLISTTISESGKTLNQINDMLSEEIKKLLILGGGVAVVVGVIRFILPSMFKRVRANLDKETEIINQETKTGVKNNAGKDSDRRIKKTILAIKNQRPIKKNQQHAIENTEEGNEPLAIEYNEGGGKKTRKRAKKITRKLKRGKRRQTRHRNGRKTKRR